MPPLFEPPGIPVQTVLIRSLLFGWVKLPAAIVCVCVCAVLAGCPRKFWTPITFVMRRAVWVLPFNGWVGQEVHFSKLFSFFFFSFWLLFFYFLTWGLLGSPKKHPQQTDAEENAATHWQRTENSGKKIDKWKKKEGRKTACSMFGLCCIERTM